MSNVKCVCALVSKCDATVLRCLRSYDDDDDDDVVVDDGMFLMMMKSIMMMLHVFPERSSLC